MEKCYLCTGNLFGRLIETKRELNLTLIKPLTPLLTIGTYNLNIIYPLLYSYFRAKHTYIYDDDDDDDWI